MKDNFSNQADVYAKFRPHYPRELIGFIIKLVPKKNIAWDCATGNGQVAGVLAEYFEKVYATDISANQLKHAVLKPNITYNVEAAEDATFPDQSLDLITVAQAIHWFNFPIFYNVAKRVLKPGGIIAVIGYGLFKTHEPVHKIIQSFYHEIVGPYWDKERKHIDEGYRTIPFPFDEMVVPLFEMKYQWTLNELQGYLTSWSAVQHYRKQNQADPVDLIKEDLLKNWPVGRNGSVGTGTVEVVFPLIVRVGKV